MSNEIQQDDPARVTFVANHVVNEQRVRLMRESLEFGGMAADNKRPKVWCEYGYPESVTSQMLYNMWRRGGVGHGAIAKVVSNCWKTNPQVIEGGEEDNARKETATDKELARVAKDLRLWSKVRECDTRRLATKYSALILRFADSRMWDEPVDTGSKKIVEVIPVWSLDLKVAQYDVDTQSETYGKPLYWDYTEKLDVGDVNTAAVRRTVRVHSDRVFIFGDYTSNAIGFLEPAYNALVSLEKVEGGSGESYLKNAARQLNINFDKDINPDKIAQLYGLKDVKGLKTELDKAARAMNMGTDSMMATQGATVTALVSNVPDPSPTYDINLQTVASALDIPTKILVGQQTGDRASTEDREAFNDRCQSRRNDLGTEISDLCAHLARCGVFKLPDEITVMWDNLNESSKSAKLDNAKKMQEINAAAPTPGEEPFTLNEIRAEAGFEPSDTQDPLSE